MLLILIVLLLVVLLVGGVRVAPRYGYGAYSPLVVVLIILLILWALGYLPLR